MGTEQGETAADSWKWFCLMHETIGSQLLNIPLFLIASSIGEDHLKSGMATCLQGHPEIPGILLPPPPPPQETLCSLKWKGLLVSQQHEVREILWWRKYYKEVTDSQTQSAQTDRLLGIVFNLFSSLQRQSL